MAVSQVQFSTISTLRNNRLPGQPPKDVAEAKKNLAAERSARQSPRNFNRAFIRQLSNIATAEVVIKTYQSFNTKGNQLTGERDQNINSRIGNDTNLRTSRLNTGREQKLNQNRINQKQNRINQNSQSKTKRINTGNERKRDFQAGNSLRTNKLGTGRIKPAPDNNTVSKNRDQKLNKQNFQSSNISQYNKAPVPKFDKFA
ncbi:hypothetical protein ACFL7D_06755 [candidate division KSB1 bacterium]